MDDTSPDLKIKQISRRWRKQHNPTRKLVLWGWDKKDNPSFVIFFGPHELDTEKKLNITKEDIETYHNSLKADLKPEINPGQYDLLKEEVKYVGYTILKGNFGHLPPFLDLKLLTPEHYNYNTSRWEKGPSYLVNRKGLYNEFKFHRRRHYRDQHLREAAAFIELSSENKFFLPYFEEISYHDKVNKINEGIFNGEFKLAKDVNEILNLSGDEKEFLELLVELMSNQTLYSRKKCLVQLIKQNPPKSIYDKIVNIGGEGIVSGLFLELAKFKNSLLKEEASKLINFTFRWSNPKFAEGAKRCAQIYLNSLDPTLRQKRITEITEIINKSELIPVYGQIPRGRAGRYLIKRDKSMSYNDYVKSWTDREWEVIGPSLKFTPSKITDGFKLNHIMFKNLIQEAEIYKNPDLIATLAYYVDTPKFHFFMKQSGHYGFYIYINRYLRRAIDSLIQEDEKLFILALKAFFSKYKSCDVISERYILSNVNNILKHYTQGPQRRSHYNYRYYSRSYSSSQDQDFKFIRTTERWQKMLKLWNNYFADILEIATKTDVWQILEFCFNIIKERSDLDNYLETLSPEVIVGLSISEHNKMRHLFQEKLTALLSRGDTFNHQLMFALMGCSDYSLHEKAWEYYERTNGNITSEMIVDLLLLNNVDDWVEFIIERVRELKGDQYYKFIRDFITKIYVFITKEIELPKLILDVLNDSANEINEPSKEDQTDLLELLVDLILHEQNLSDWLSHYLQNVIFSISYDNLSEFIKRKDIDFSAEIPNKTFLSVLRAFATDRLPYDKEILEILEKGTPKMVKTFIEMVGRNKYQLSERSQTLQLLFESEVATLNELAIIVFENLPKEAFNKTLSILIDSPEKKVTDYALKKLDEIYGDKVPKNLIIQMLEHNSPDIKSYISEKIDRILEELSSVNSDIFLYYVKTLIFLPNLQSKSKDRIYQLIPEFALRNKENRALLEEILLEIGGSNIIKDSERALVALAKIKTEVY